MTRPVSDDVMRALADARALGFLGPGELKAHVASAERFAEGIEAVDAVGPALDLGSGGGVPGLVLASWFETWSWVLLDAQRRRTSFLAAAVARVGLAARVEVVRGRAEEVGHRADRREHHGLVTARSFGPPAATAEAAAPFVRVGGVVVVAEPPGEPARWPADGLATVGLAVERASAAGVRVLRKTDPTPASYPRSAKRQQASPLF